MARSIISPIRVLMLIVVAMTLLLAAETVVLATSTTRTGKSVSAVKIVSDPATAEPYALTTSLEYAAIPGMSTTITVPANAKALLLITFSAESRCTQDLEGTSAQCLVRALVNSNMVAPGEVVFDNANESWEMDDPWLGFEANSMQFVAGPLKPGTYTVAMQYRTLNGGPVFELQSRTLSVLRSTV
jgi:hypothetical protein